MAGFATAATHQHQPASRRAARADTVAAAVAVTAVADDYVAAYRVRNPEWETIQGLAGARHESITDNGLAAAAAWEAREDGWLERLRDITPATLVGHPEWSTYVVLRQQLESAVALRTCHEDLWPVSQFSGWPTRYTVLAGFQPVGTDSLRRAALKRYGDLPRFVDTEVANLRTGMQRGYTAPKLIVRATIAQIDALLAIPTDKSPFRSPATRDSAPGFRASFDSLLDSALLPAARRYREFLNTTYLPAAREAIGLSANPDGLACYRAQLARYSSINMTPEAVHELGLTRMAAVTAEMDTLASRSFHTHDLSALLQRIKTDTAYTYHSREEIIAQAESALARATRALPKWFGVLPNAPVRIEPVPAFREKNAAPGQYYPAADDGSRPGTYFIRLYEPRQQSRSLGEDVAFHEMVPGHHLQFTIAQERKGAHPVTRYFRNSGYTEGWGLYSERLADEMGLYSSPLDRLGMMSGEAFRAARAVVDPGIHALGWTRDQAVAYMLAHTATSPDQVNAEVDRYIAMPGQAPSYLIGQQEILAIRTNARQRLGSKFDIRAFHDHVLGQGALPLANLRESIARWVATMR
jgi:uncharacterized protein (DUF885 family)